MNLVYIRCCTCTYRDSNVLLFVQSTTGKPRTQFFAAVLRNETATVRTMLSATGSQSFINYQDTVNEGGTPLHAAAAHGHSDVTELLIEARCNVDLHHSSGSTPVLHKSL